MLLLMAALTHAEIYKTTDASGQVSYSDQPSAGAVRVQVAPLPTVPPVATTTSVGTASNNAPVSASNVATVQRPSYQLSFQSPGPETYIRRGETLNVAVTLSPALAGGDQIVMLMNGQPVGTGGPQASINTETLDRGSYTITAQVVDTQGQVLATQSASFTVMQASRLINPAARQNQISGPSGVIRPSRFGR